MKTKFAFMMMLSFYLVSCSKIVEPVSVDTDSKGSSSVLSPSGAKISYNGAIQYYEVDPAIVGYFSHFCQSNSANTDIKSNGCGPVAYTMAAACLAAYKGYTLSNYTGTKPWDTKAQHMKNNISGGVPMTINYLPSYINSFDKYASSNSSVNLINYTTSFVMTQTQTKAFIETSLQYNRFVLVPLQAHVYSRSIVDGTNLYVNGSTNPDYGISETTDSYISDKSNNTTATADLKVGGHYVLIVALRKNTLASGGDIIEYIDPLANTRASGLSNRKYCNYDRFVASMHKNSLVNPGKANAIAIY